MLRPTTRVCHARQNVPLEPPQPLERPARFEKNARRWCATPQFLRELHRELNDKIDQIAAEPEFDPALTPGDGSHPGTCIIASGVAFAHTWDLLEDLGLLGQVDFYQVTMPYPLNRDFVREVNRIYHKVLVLEETYPVIELQLANGQIQGRRSRAVPKRGADPGRHPPHPGEISRICRLQAAAAGPQGEATRPTLCAGCAHRAAFYAIRETFPGGHLSQRHRLLHPGDEPGGGGHLPLHGRRASARPRASTTPTPPAGERVPHHRGHHRRLHLFPRRDPGPDQCGVSWGAVYPGHSGQLHHRHDRAPAHPPGGPHRHRRPGPGGLYP